jgi:hypothetical protein
LPVLIVYRIPSWEKNCLLFRHHLSSPWRNYMTKKIKTLAIKMAKIFNKWINSYVYHIFSTVNFYFL